MPDMYFDVDVAITECPVNIMPLIDDTDFKTIEGAVAYNAAGMALFWHFCTSAGAYTVTAVTPTTAGVYDWTDQGAAGIYTIEIPASGGGSINNDTEGYGWFTGSATGVLPWRGPIIGFRAAALNDALMDGGDNLDVNTVQWLGTACATPTVAGVPEVDLTHIAGDAQSATDMKDFADAGYDPATNKVQGVVLVDTLTTYTGNTLQTGDSFARIGAPAGASIAADLVVIDNFVDGIESTLAAGVVLADASSDAVIADAVWNAATATYGAAGSYGLLVETDLDAAISSRMATYTQPAGFLAATFPTTVASTTNITAATGITVSTNSDKTGYGLSAAAVQEIWDAATTALITVGSIGKKLADWVVGTIDTYTGNTKQTGDNFARLGAPAGASVSADVAAIKAETVTILADTNDIQTRIPAALVGGRMDASVGAVAANAITAASIAADAGAEIAAAVLTTQMTESYRAAGAAPTLAQAAFETIGHLGESAIVSTTKTVKKIDGTTAAKTYTLDSATTPTSITETT